MTEVESSETAEEPVKEAEEPLGFQEELIQMVGKEFVLSEKVLPVQEAEQESQGAEAEPEENSSGKEPRELLGAEPETGTTEPPSEPLDRSAEEPQLEEEKTDKTKERRSRKRLLQDYLPFS